jgi:hypothetical protein
MELETEKNKQVIGLFGEMQLAMILHEKGWQVHRSYIDEGIDFTITKYWCNECDKYSNQFIRYKNYKSKNTKCVTNLCEHCQKNKLDIVSKYLQVKTSEGIATNDENINIFSFHPKIRYDLGNNVFYVWIAVFNDKTRNEITNKICHYYIFNTNDVNKFDDTKIDTYQITDNQKTSLRINIDGKVLNSGVKYDYSCFNNLFYNNFDILERF